MLVKFSKLTPTAIIPTCENPAENAGYDFYADIENPIEVKWGLSTIIPTSIAWEPMTDPSWRAVLKIFSRSGLGIKHGIECSNAGVIDDGYRGNIMIKMYNLSEKDYEIKPGDRIAQGIIYLIPRVVIVEEDYGKLSDSTRGTNGFGSSGR